MGAGANDVEFTAGTLVARGAVSIQHDTHDTGTSITNLSPYIAQYKSTLTISYVDGTNSTTIGATYDVSTSGLLKITGGSGPDTITLNGGNINYAGAVSIAGGDGDDSITLAGSSGHVWRRSERHGRSRHQFPRGAADFPRRPKR